MAITHRAGAKIQRTSQTVRSVFISYSHANVAERDAFLKFLRPLCERLGDKPIWVDHEVLRAGTRWKSEIRAGLEDADVYIVLMSQDYCASHFCMHDELAFILRKCEQGQAQAIGVALHKLNLSDFTVVLEDGRPCGLGEFQCLPQGLARSAGQERLGLLPINQWPDDRDAWHEVQVQLEQALACNRSTARSRPAPVPEPNAEPDERVLALPYLCDRQQQAEDLWFCLGEWFTAACHRPLVILSEGCDRDCLQQWVERIARHEFANALPSFDTGELQFSLLQVFGWPAGVCDAADATRRLTMQWARGLGCKPMTPLAELQRIQAERMMPTLWWTEVPADLDIEVTGHGLTALASLLAGWPDTTGRNPLVLALNLMHPDQRAMPISVKSMAKQMRAVSDWLNLVEVGALPLVTRFDLPPWSSDPRIQPDLPRCDLQQLRAQLAEPLPMRDFVDVYNRWVAEG